MKKLLLLTLASGLCTAQSNMDIKYQPIAVDTSVQLVAPKIGHEVKTFIPDTNSEQFQELRQLARQKIVEDLVVSNTGLSPQAVELAFDARSCALKHQQTKNSGNLTIIDFSRPSTEKRLFIVNPTTGDVLVKEWVAHGAKSGGVVASEFSNVQESNKSSLGLIEPTFEFTSSKGRSVRLSGLYKGMNDKVYDREIIIHPSQYIGNGKTGRSLGCPAVRTEAIDVVVNGVKGGLVYAYHQNYTAQLQEVLKPCQKPQLPENKLFANATNLCPTNERLDQQLMAAL